MSFVESVERFTNAEIRLKESMKKHTTLRVGGKADYFIRVKSVKDLRTAIELCKDYKIKHVVLGNGSNVLVADGGYKGAVINLGGLSFIKQEKQKTTAFAGVSLSKLCAFLLQSGFTGYEGLCGIPGSVGGAVAMHAGAFGYSVSDCIEEASVLINGDIKTFWAKECGFKYRTSRFLKPDTVIVSATFVFSKGNADNAKKKIEYYRLKRKGVQPSGNSAGSTFKNPNGDYAARLIDELNLKGFCIGGAKISEKHSNFIITDQTATAKDVFAVITEIEKQVKERYGLNLKREIRLVGDFNDFNGRLSYSHNI